MACIRRDWQLNEKDMYDLPWYNGTAYGGIGVGTLSTKEYNQRQVECRAWEVYGGPMGLKAAIQA